MKYYGHRVNSFQKRIPDAFIHVILNFFICLETMIHDTQVYVPEKFNMYCMQYYQRLSHFILPGQYRNGKFDEC